MSPLRPQEFNTFPIAAREVLIWGFPKIRGTILRVPIIGIIVYWGLYWGPLILGNYHIVLGLDRIACHA